MVASPAIADEQATSAPMTLVFGNDNGDDADIIAFVGEKISLRAGGIELGPDEILMDSVHDAEYRVRQIVRGEYASPVIRFMAFDHYGTPAFSTHDPVLLFVRASRDGFVHVKYQYVPLYPTERHGLAACVLLPVDDGDGTAVVRGGEPVPQVMRFDARSEEAFGGLRVRQIRERYRPESYTIVAGRPRCRLGLTPEQSYRRWAARRVPTPEHATESP